MHPKFGKHLILQKSSSEKTSSYNKTDNTINHTFVPEWFEQIWKRRPVPTIRLELDVLKPVLSNPTEQGRTTKLLVKI